MTHTGFYLCSGITEASKLHFIEGHTKVRFYIQQRQHLGRWENTRKVCNTRLTARDLQVFLMFSQQPMWFIEPVNP